MKVLYIGHYKEFGGWAQAATDNILALDKVGVDVACRNVTLTQDKQNIEIPDQLRLDLKSFSQSVGPSFSLSILLTACNSSDDFMSTETGLMYKFHHQNFYFFRCYSSFESLVSKFLFIGTRP